MEIKTNNIDKREIIEGLKIYNYFILNSLSNFEEKVLSIQKFNEMLIAIRQNKLPLLLLKMQNKVVGIAFVNKFREKSGYRFTFEHSIYISPNNTNQGLGSLLLRKLINECKKNKKIKNLIAVIGGSDNIASIKIHEKNGFKHIGTLKKIGFKKNKWIDSVYMQKKL
tara:strand:+ start:610 stop:1110 length:501 start_codon:yes stop_codon:yes gene_type:complete